MRPPVAVRHLLVVALAVLVAGCASLPTSGTVRAGGDVNAPGVRSALRVAADGPAPGADERAVVEGFLAAVAGLDDYRVAREFLAPEALDWRPADRTVVYEDVTRVGVAATEEGAEVTVGATVVARIDGNGRFSPQPPEVEDQVFRLVQVEGEWRIAGLPPGVLVSRVDAERVLTAFGVYFPDPTGTYLVPDVRWFPQLTSSATSLVRALLAGPSSPYLGALTSAAPAGTRLDLPSVPVENGEATVELTEEVLDADGTQRSLLLAQLRQTLRAVPGVSSVRVTVDGSPLDEPTGNDVIGTSSLVVDPAVDDRPYVLAPPDGPPDPDEAATDEAGTDEAGTDEAGTDEAGTDEGGSGSEAPVEDPDEGATDAAAEQGPGEPELGDDGRPLAPAGSALLRLDLDGPREVEGTRALAEVVATGLAAAPDGRTFAGLDATRGSMWVQQPGSPPVELVTGTDLVTPSFDPLPLQHVWTVSNGSGDDVPRVLAAASTVEEVEARWLQVGDTVRALRVSRDGARALVVVEDADGGVVVEVRGIRRDGSGRPESLSQAAFRVAPQLVDAVDAAWVSDDDVVVLGRVGDEPVRPVLAQVGGETTSLAPTPGAVTVSAALGERSVVVGTADGTVLRRSGGLWIDGPFGVAPAHRG